MYRRTAKYAKRREWHPRPEVAPGDQRPAQWHPPHLAALKRRIAEAPVVTVGAIVRGDVVMSVTDDPERRVHLLLDDGESA